VPIGLAAQPKLALRIGNESGKTHTGSKCPTRTFR
jgi:hypothetical protein